MIEKFKLHHFLWIAFNLLFVSIAYSRCVWDKYETNPVLPAGNPGYWDDQTTGATSVIVQNDTFKMWYGGIDNEFLSIQTGYASGIYYYSLRAGYFVSTRKLVLLK